MKAHTEYDNNKWMIASLILAMIAVGIICFTVGYDYSLKHNKIVILNNGLEMRKTDMESFANVFYNSSSSIMEICNLETKSCYKVLR